MTRQLRLILLLSIAISCSGYRWRCYAFCNEQTAVQNDYTEQRDECRDFAQDNLETEMAKTTNPNSGKVRKAKLITLFSECMSKYGWDVPTPEDKGKFADNDGIPIYTSTVERVKAANNPENAPENIIVTDPNTLEQDNIKPPQEEPYPRKIPRDNPQENIDKQTEKSTENLSTKSSSTKKVEKETNNADSSHLVTQRSATSRTTGTDEAQPENMRSQPATTVRSAAKDSKSPTVSKKQAVAKTKPKPPAAAPLPPVTKNTTELKQVEAGKEAQPVTTPPQPAANTRSAVQDIKSENISRTETKIQKITEIEQAKPVITPPPVANVTPQQPAPNVRSSVQKVQSEDIYKTESKLQKNTEKELAQAEVQQPQPLTMPQQRTANVKSTVNTKINSDSTTSNINPEIRSAQEIRSEGIAKKIGSNDQKITGNEPSLIIPPQPAITTSTTSAPTAATTTSATTAATITEPKTKPPVAQSSRSNITKQQPDISSITNEEEQLRIIEQPTSATTETNNITNITNEEQLQQIVPSEPGNNVLTNPPVANPPPLPNAEESGIPNQPSTTKNTSKQRATECEFARRSAGISSIAAAQAKACEAECTKLLKTMPKTINPAPCPPKDTAVNVLDLQLGNKK